MQAVVLCVSPLYILVNIQWFFCISRQQQMEAERGTMQEGCTVRRRDGVRVRVAPARGGRGAAQLVPGAGQLRVLLRLPLPGTRQQHTDKISQSDSFIMFSKALKVTRTIPVP